MDNKQTEDLITAALNAEKPNKYVLSAAKAITKQNALRHRRRVRLSFALAGCCLALLIAGVVFTAIAPPPSSFGAMSSAESLHPSRYYFITGLSLLAAGVISGIAALIIGLKNKIGWC
jgi:hypothetical protein